MPIGPSIGERHVDAALTDVSIAHSQSQEDALLYNVVPLVPVERQSDKFTVFDPATWNKRQARIRGAGGHYKFGGYTVSKTPYYCDIYSIAHSDPRESQQNVDPVHDPQVENTAWVTNQLMLEADALIASRIFAPGVWTTDIVGVSSGAAVGTSVQYWDTDGSDPATDMVMLGGLVKKRCQFNPSEGGLVAVLGFTVYLRLLNHAAIVDRVKYTSSDSVRKEILARLFEVKKVIVPGLVANTANEGQTASYDFLVDDLSVGLYYVPNSPGKRTLSAAYVFGWTGFDGFSDGFRISTGYEKDNNSDLIYGDVAIDPQVTAAGAGAFILNAVQA